MKHAILILAHKDILQLCKLVGYFRSRCEVFIHVDKRSEFTENDLKMLRNLPNVSGVYREYSVHWAGFTILKCELYLLKQALIHSDADYFHLISGQDYPIKPFNIFMDFFEQNGDKEYLGFMDIPNGYWEGETYRRFQYYQPNDWLNARSKMGKKIVKILLDWQKKLKIRRRIPDQFDRLYGGSAWFSITREGGRTLLEYTQKHSAFYRRLKYTFVPEETYVSTVLVNLLSCRICNNNYRFVQWVMEKGDCISASLTEKHFFKLVRTDAFFARKLDYPSCEKLIQLIDKYMLQEGELTITDSGSWIVSDLYHYSFDLPLSNAFINLFLLMKINSAVDLGCGPGLYVAELRRKGVPIMGYDGNPHVMEISSLLLRDEYPCEVVDLTDELETDESFDLVLCLDVCSYISKQNEERVILNLVNNSGKYIILSWATPRQEREGYVNKQTNEYVIQKFWEYGFVENIPAKNYLREQASLPWLKDALFVFQK